MKCKAWVIVPIELDWPKPAFTDIENAITEIFNGLNIKHGTIKFPDGEAMVLKYSGNTYIQEWSLDRGEKQHVVMS